MQDIITEIGLNRLAEFLLNIDSTPVSLQLGLFVNSRHFDCQTTIELLTECTSPGYERIQFDHTRWVPNVTDCQALFSYPAQVFGITGSGPEPVTVYGHFVIDIISSGVLWGASWDTPWAIPTTAAANPVLTPTFSLFNCNDLTGAPE